MSASDPFVHWFQLFYLDNPWQVTPADADSTSVYVKTISVSKGWKKDRLAIHAVDIFTVDGSTLPPKPKTNAEKRNLMDAVICALQGVSEKEVIGCTFDRVIYGGE